jgi:hypothetical protein
MSEAATIDFEERRRLAYVAEINARDIKLAADFRAKSNRTMADLNAAMRAAGCACKVLIEPHDKGDYVGMMVYADSAAGAKRAAEWLVKWEERDYAANGGRYGGSYGQAQGAYRVSEALPPKGAPFAAYAAFRYYSRGD